MTRMYIYLETEMLTEPPRCSPFLQFVSDRETFDQQLDSYLQTSYIQEK